MLVSDAVPLLLLILASVYATASVVSFVLMGLDKRAARLGRRRTPESTLHLIELLGGFLGSFAAQHIFRHKRRKLAYQLPFWLIVIIHAIGWFVWFNLRG